MYVLYITANKHTKPQIQTVTVWLPQDAPFGANIRHGMEYKNSFQNKNHGC